MKKAIVFPTGRGVPYVVDVPEDCGWEWMRDKISSEWIEIVRPVRLPNGYVMIVDEEGILNRKPPNMVGSWFYASDKHGEAIVGDILIMKEVFGEEGADCVGMSDDEVNMIFDLIREGE